MAEPEVAEVGEYPGTEKRVVAGERLWFERLFGVEPPLRPVVEPCGGPVGRHPLAGSLSHFNVVKERFGVNSAVEVPGPFAAGPGRAPDAGSRTDRTVVVDQQRTSSPARWRRVGSVTHADGTLP